MTSDSRDNPKDQNLGEERNPFVAFKHHIDQRFAALLGLQQSAYQQRRWEEQQRKQHNGWQPTSKNGDGGETWERAMRDFEESEKEAKEWYDTVLKQITSRRDEHLESGLGFEGPSTSTTTEATQCPYLPPKEERIPLLPNKETSETVKDVLQQEAPSGRCTRQQPHSRLLDWVWTGWGGPSTTSDMLWYHEPKSQDPDKERRRGCKWSQSVPPEMYSADVAKTSQGSECPVPGEIVSYGADTSSTSEGELEKALGAKTNEFFDLMQSVKQDLRQAYASSLDHESDPDAYRARVEKFDDLVERGNQMVRRTADQVMGSESVMHFLGPMLFGSGLLRTTQAVEENDQTELASYEHTIGRQHIQRQAQPFNMVKDYERQSEHDQQVSNMPISQSQTTETHTDELGNVYRLKQKIERMSDGSTKTTESVSYTDQNGNLLGEQTSEHYDMEERIPASNAVHAASYPTLRVKHSNAQPDPNLSTYTEAMKLLEKQKNEQKKAGGWFWKS